MALSTKDFTTLVQEQVTAIQGASHTIIDLAIGSIIRSIVEANTGVVLWLQGLLLTLLATTRAATSSGVDLDSWVADYALFPPRIEATYAVGQVTFSRFTSTQSATIAVGTKVQTADGSQSFMVIADPDNPAYNAGTLSYIIAIGVASITVLVTAVAAGSAGNALAGTVNTLGTSIIGVDTTVNSTAFAGGADAESDPSVRSRFVSFIGSLSKSTKMAIGFAIQSVQVGVTYKLVENQTLAGVYKPGYFFAVVDDGSGSPPQSLLDAVQAAVDLVRPIGSTFGVFAPVILSGNVNMSLVTAEGYDHLTLVADVRLAISEYMNSILLSEKLPYTRLAQIGYNVSPGITNVTGVTLNGVTADLVPGVQQVIKPGTLSIN